MFKIIGSDGREYGPVSADQVRQWIAQGRANAQTLTQTVGTTEWKPLGSFVEFGGGTPSLPPAAPPVTATTSPMVPPTTNSMAVAGLAFGLLGFTGCCGPLFSILGIIFSSVGLSQIRRNPTQEAGRAMAVTGLVLSIIGIVAGVVMGILFGTTRMWVHHPLFWHRHW